MNCHICGKEVKNKSLYKDILNSDNDSFINVLNCFGKWITVCKSCVETNRNIIECEECGKYFYEDITLVQNHKCRVCELNYYNNDITLDYEYKPAPIFFPKKEKNTLYMGIELEMDFSIDDGNSDNTNEMKDFVLNQKKYGYSFFYGKHDGSLNSYGIEIVSHPATLQYHLETNYWKDMLNKASSLGFKSNDCSQCGIHIHCNKDYFSSYEIQKLDALLNWHSRTFRRFARRNPRSYGAFEPNKSRDRLGVNNNCGDRYSALNFHNENTVEWRIFKGNLKYESIMALFELVQGVSDFIKKDEIDLGFICGDNDYLVKKSLKEYLESRNFKYLPDYTEMCKVWRDLENVERVAS